MITLAFVVVRILSSMALGFFVLVVSKSGGMASMLLYTFTRGSSIFCSPFSMADFAGILVVKADTKTLLNAVLACGFFHDPVILVLVAQDAMVNISNTITDTRIVLFISLSLSSAIE